MSIDIQRPSDADIQAREQDILGHPPRIEPLPREQIEQQALDSWTELRSHYAGKQLEPGPRENIPAIFFTMLRRPELWKAVSGMTHALSVGAEMTVRDREIVILRTGWLTQAPFEWGEHVKKGKDAGLSELEIEQIIEGSTAAGWSEHDAALCRAVEELHANAMITDATWAVLAKQLNQNQLIELPFLIGQFTLVGYFQNALRLPLGVNNDGLRSR